MRDMPGLTAHSSLSALHIVKLLFRDIGLSSAQTFELCEALNVTPAALDQQMHTVSETWERLTAQVLLDQAPPVEGPSMSSIPQDVVADPATRMDMEGRPVPRGKQRWLRLLPSEKQILRRRVASQGCKVSAFLLAYNEGEGHAAAHKSANVSPNTTKPAIRVYKQFGLKKMLEALDRGECNGRPHLLHRDPL